MAALEPRSFQLEIQRGVATITLDRPKRLNAVTFEVYTELADTLEALGNTDAARAVIITGQGKGFCSGGDQDDIIAELFSRDAKGLLDFTRISGRLISRVANGRGLVASLRVSSFSLRTLRSVSGSWATTSASMISPLGSVQWICVV